MEGSTGLRENLIRQTEQAIDGLRKRKDLLDRELAEIEPQMEEARAMLQMLKTGQMPTTNNQSRRPLSIDQVLEALQEMPQEFTTHDFADLLDTRSGNAAVWCKRFMDEGLLERTVLGRGHTPSNWRKVNG